MACLPAAAIVRASFQPLEGKPERYLLQEGRLRKSGEGLVAYCSVFSLYRAGLAGLAGPAPSLPIQQLPLFPPVHRRDTRPNRVSNFYGSRVVSARRRAERSALRGGWSQNSRDGLIVSALNDRNGCGKYGPTTPVKVLSTLQPNPLLLLGDRRRHAFCRHSQLFRRRQWTPAAALIPFLMLPTS